MKKMPVTNREVILPEGQRIISTTDLKGQITYVNKVFCDIAGYTEEELIGRPHNIVRHPDMPKEAFKDLVEDLGLKQKSTSKDVAYYRHPLAYLVEAADDICYTIIDFEDGINLGLIEEDFALEYLIKLVKDSIDTQKYHSLQHTKDRVSYLRALAINTLINEAVDIFLANEAAILNGEFDKSLLDKCKYEAQINDIIKISVAKIYKSNDVVEKEVAGYKIIADLLDVFVNALNNTYLGKASNYDKLVLNVLPSEYKTDKTNVYDRIMLVCSFVSKMSDSYAIRLHKKLNGNLI